MFEFKPDYEAAKRRIDAWWEGQVLDRALTMISFPKPASERIPEPVKEHVSLRERWLDTQFQAERAYAQAANTVWYADSLPIKFPNLGPDVFAAFFGCELEFGETTSWSFPIWKEWPTDALERLWADTANFYFRKIMEMTDAYLELARGKFIVGYTDLHPGADCLAALRDPQALCVDLLERPDEVKAACERVTDEFLRIYEIFHARLASAGMPSASWIGIVSDGRFHIPSCDFSCMISDRLFQDIFLPGIVRECAHMDRNIYHLDGPGALRFLDVLLEVPKLHAVQWVPGAGREGWKRWIPVYQRIQAAGKSFVVYVSAGELEELFSYLRPEGAWLSVGGVRSREEADAVLSRISRWGCKP